MGKHTIPVCSSLMYYYYAPSQKLRTKLNIMAVECSILLWYSSPIKVLRARTQTGEACMCEYMHTNSPSEEFIVAAPLFGMLMPDPNAVVKERLKPLRPQWDELLLVSDWLFSVRGLKCLQRQLLMFCRICLRSGEEAEVCDDDVGKEVLL